MLVKSLLPQCRLVCMATCFLAALAALELAPTSTVGEPAVSPVGSSSTAAEESRGAHTPEALQEQLQDKWLSDRLTEFVNWNRLSVDAGALSRVLLGAKQVAQERTAHVKSREHLSRRHREDIYLELLKQSEMLADNLDQLLGLLHRLEREATAEGVGFNHNGWNLVISTEEAVGAAGAFADALDEATINARSPSSRGSDLPAVALQLSSALNGIGPDPTGGRLGEAIGKQQLVPLLQDLSEHHLLSPPHAKQAPPRLMPVASTAAR
ncbi:hypothetical protein ACSSS7_000895 [Eimeria intestinalis]